MPRITRHDEPDEDADDLDSRDDDPIDEDLERFGGDEVECPSCGAPVWSEADRCPRCGEFLEGDPAAPSQARRLQGWWRHRWTSILVIMIIIALLGLVPALVWSRP